MDVKPMLGTLAAAVVVLTLSSCGNDGAATPPSDDLHAGVSADGAEPDSGADATASERPATVENVAAAAGVLQAAQLGFDLSAVASTDDLQALRESLPDALDGVVVAPSSCTDPLTELNWSPALLGEDAARTDVAAENVGVTGTVEVARVGDRAGLDGYYASVESLLADCSQVTLNVQKPAGDGAVTPVTGPLSFSTPSVTREVDSAVFWARFPQDADLKQESLVLVEEAGDYVALVSFTGAEGVKDERITQVAEAILDVTIQELEAQQRNKAAG